MPIPIDTFLYLYISIYIFAADPVAGTGLVKKKNTNLIKLPCRTAWARLYFNIRWSSLWGNDSIKFRSNTNWGSFHRFSFRLNRLSKNFRFDRRSIYSCLNRCCINNCLKGASIYDGFNVNHFINGFDICNASLRQINDGRGNVGRCNRVAISSDALQVGADGAW